MVALNETKHKRWQQLGKQSGIGFNVPSCWHAMLK